MRATAIDHVNLSVPADRLDEVLDFYVDALGFETRFDDPRAAVADDPGLFPVLFGDDGRLYVNPTDDFDPATTNFRHVALRIPASPSEVREALADAGVEIESEAERERESVGAYTSYYVADPFGYTVELMAVGG